MSSRTPVYKPAISGIPAAINTTRFTNPRIFLPAGLRSNTTLVSINISKNGTATVHVRFVVIISIRLLYHFTSGCKILEPPALSKAPAHVLADFKNWNGLINCKSFKHKLNSCGIAEANTKANIMSTPINPRIPTELIVAVSSNPASCNVLPNRVYA